MATNCDSFPSSTDAARTPRSPLTALKNGAVCRELKKAKTTAIGGLLIARSEVKIVHAEVKRGVGLGAANAEAAKIRFDIAELKRKWGKECFDAYVAGNSVLVAELASSAQIKIASLEGRLVELNEKKEAINKATEASRVAAKTERGSAADPRARVTPSGAFWDHQPNWDNQTETSNQAGSSDVHGEKKDVDEAFTVIDPAETSKNVSI